jgi:hypothetical protein
MKPTRPVRVQIDRLVLKGFRYKDRHAVARGMQEQLTRLLSQPDMARRLSRIGSLPELHVRQAQITADAKPHQVGIAAANGIGKEIER